MPFALLHACGLCVYLLSPVHEDAATLAMPLFVLLHALFFLSTHWSVSVRCRTQLVAVKSPAEAALVCVRPRSGRPSLCELTPRPAGAPFGFEYLQRSYTLVRAADASAGKDKGSAAAWRCEPLRMPVDDDYGHYLQECPLTPSTP